MLLEFSCANFRSINQKCTLSMQAQGIADEPHDNIATIGKNARVLKTAAIYGANSSGKSNIIRAFSMMIYQVVNSVKLNVDDELDFDPFRLTSDNAKPTFFEVKFILENRTYRYGFEYTSTSIVGEWLFSSAVGGKREKILFIRNEDGIGVDEKRFPEGVDKEASTNQNRLFISLCAQLGGDISQKLLAKFNTMGVISGIYSQGYSGYSKMMFHKHLKGCDEAERFFEKINLGFLSIETRETEFDDTSLPSNISNALKSEIAQTLKGKKKIDVFSRHNVYNAKGRVVDTIVFDIDNESDGTKKLIELSGPVFDTLAEGGLIIVDELDAKMHPLISKYIVELFNDPSTNPNNAQLIFSTHDTHLLSSKLLRRDQIWFTEKDSKEQTDLYNMMDIELPDKSKPRSDSNFEKNYIAGRYGAIPYIKD